MTKRTLTKLDWQEKVRKELGYDLLKIRNLTKKDLVGLYFREHFARVKETKRE